MLFFPFELPPSKKSVSREKNNKRDSIGCNTFRGGKKNWGRGIYVIAKTLRKGKKNEGGKNK